VGRVILVGGGPGDPDLITVRGAAALGQADVVLHDELSTDELLSLARDDAELVNVGKRGHDFPSKTQDEINALIVKEAQAGKTVVRLKGGDPFVFGRGGEEASVCVEAGVPFEVVPGVTSAVAALAYAGIPVTDRRYAASFAVVTGHKDPTKPARETRWRELGTAVDTLVILMGMRNLSDLTKQLIEGGKSPETPAAAIMNGTRPDQRVVVAPLGELCEEVVHAGLGAPTAVVVGNVVSLREQLVWWERLPLFGMQVLVTRATQQAREMSAAVRAAGAVPVVMPMIEIEPPSDPEAVAAIESALAELPSYDAILFNSINTVRFFASAIRRAGLGDQIARLGCRILCIGARTAREAFDAGFAVHMVAQSGGDAESMLEEILRAGPVEGTRILIPRSEIGRNVLPDGLRAAGAEVNAIQIYRNVPAEVNAEALRRRLVDGALPILTFTSPSIVRNFVDLLDEPSREAASRCIIAAIGRTTGRALERAGLPADVIPERPDVRALVQAVSERVAARAGERDDHSRSDDPGG
jgi:uroporphyrinogen III methyltransferase/synthase